MSRLPVVSLIFLSGCSLLGIGGGQTKPPTHIPVIVYDTVRRPVVVTDTTHNAVTIYDSTHVPVTVPDTSRVPVTVYDTSHTPVTVYDTSHVPVFRYDTTVTRVPVSVFDTTHIPVTTYDTTKKAVTVYDTTHTTVVLPDTLRPVITLPDTVRPVVTIPDTTHILIIVRDTVFVTDTLPRPSGVPELPRHMDEMDAMLQSAYASDTVTRQIFDLVGKTLVARVDSLGRPQCSKIVKFTDAEGKRWEKPETFVCPQAVVDAVKARSLTP